MSRRSFGQGHKLQVSLPGADDSNGTNRNSHRAQLFVCLFACLLGRSCICTCVRWCVRSFFRSLDRLFVRSFVRLFLRLLVSLFLCLLLCLLVCLFVVVVLWHDLNSALYFADNFQRGWHKAHNVFPSLQCLWDRLTFRSVHGALLKDSCQVQEIQ